MSFNPFRVFQTLIPEVAEVDKPVESGSGYFNGQAIVDEAIAPGQAGRVRFRGSYWSARCDQAIALQAGEVVDVVGLERITLKVEPAFMLRASDPGLERILQACQRRGWVQQEPEWVVDAGDEPIQALTATRVDTPAGSEGSAQEPLSPEMASEIWQRFVQGKPIYITSF
jgi:hypothetical protein